MKKLFSWMSVALTLTLVASAQTDTADIFADLQDFEPVAVPVAPAPAPIPAPTPAPATAPDVVATMEPAAPVSAPPMIVQPPMQKGPVVYTMENRATLSVPEKAVQPAEPLDIEKTLEMGRKAYGSRDLNSAQGFFEAVLHEDAYNPDAIRWLHRIADKKDGREEKSYDTTRARMLETVQASWNTPKAEGTPPDSGKAVREPTEAEQRTAALRAKLETIQIPAITFQDADIQQVVLELSALCRKLDPERKGANLVVFGTSETILPSITFSGTDLSAIETLDIITQMSGMKYDIGPNMVSLTPVNYEPPQQMVSTEFDIIPSVGTKMMLRSDGDATGLVDVRGFFSSVPFPPGSSAQYNPEFNVLLIHNVPKHLDKISDLLAHYNRKAAEERAQQVEIETKFIEVSQGALDELGFEWTLGVGQDYVNNDTWAVDGDQKLFSDTLRTGLEAFGSTIEPANRATAFNALAGAVIDPTGTGLIDEAGTMLIQKIKGDRINLVISALERTAGSDLLSAPKVLTRSGETATIHVGEVHWYPTAYDISIERYAQPSLVPLDYEEEKTGVMLEVTPELDPETGTINMKLSPEIRELAGFDEQHVGTIWPEFGDEALDIDGTAGGDLIDFLTQREKNRTISADRLIARRPIFKTRKVDTSVTIEDGSTIAMGGLIKEQMETFKDSVPILGRIPIIGRFFRSEGERSVKRNLLIFVTANQVDASGYKKAAQ